MVEQLKVFLPKLADADSRYAGKIAEYLLKINYLKEAPKACECK